MAVSVCGSVCRTVQRPQPFPPFTADYIVTVNQSLTLQLIITNQSKDAEFTFENCLHTYFDVGDVTAISISGLKGLSYLDKVAGFVERTETSDALRIASEVDRIYQNATGTVGILDPRLGRKIRVEKQGSASTVVWNPVDSQVAADARLRRRGI